MEKQTQDYIALKPIAERFKNVANSLTDSDIKLLIKDELRTQMREQIDFGNTVSTVIEEWINDNEDFLIDNFKSGIAARLK